MSKLALLKTRVKEFTFLEITDRSTLICKLCGVEFKQIDRKSHIVQHAKTEKHQNHAKNLTTIQTTLKTVTHVQSTFNKALCKMLVAADIPLWKVQNPHFRQFFLEFCSKRIPDESTLRRFVLPELYLDKLSEMRAAFKDKFLWVAIDETTDSCGRYVVNVVAGPLDSSMKVSISFNIHFMC